MNPRQADLQFFEGAFDGIQIGAVSTASPAEILCQTLPGGVKAETRIDDGVKISSSCCVLSPMFR